MRVWIDQDLCTGPGTCVQECPEVFVLGSDGIAYVKQGEQVLSGGIAGAAEVPDYLAEAVLDATDACPHECIFVEA